MNYQLLKKALPKQPENWDVNDVAKWLEFIYLGKYADRFSKLMGYLRRKTS